VRCVLRALLRVLRDLRRATHLTCFLVFRATCVAAVAPLRKVERQPPQRPAQLACPGPSRAPPPLHAAPPPPPPPDCAPPPQSPATPPRRTPRPTRPASRASWAATSCRGWCWSTGGRLWGFGALGMHSPLCSCSLCSLGKGNLYSVGSVGVNPPARNGARPRRRLGQPHRWPDARRCAHPHFHPHPSFQGTGAPQLLPARAPCFAPPLRPQDARQHLLQMAGRAVVPPRRRRRGRGGGRGRPPRGRRRRGRRGARVLLLAPDRRGNGAAVVLGSKPPGAWGRDWFAPVCAAHAAAAPRARVRDGVMPPLCFGLGCSVASSIRARARKTKD
jgi:hypothetical protein